MSLVGIDLFGQGQEQVDQIVSIEQLTLFFDAFKIWPQRSV